MKSDDSPGVSKKDSFLSDIILFTKKYNNVLVYFLLNYELLINYYCLFQVCWDADAMQPSIANYGNVLTIF